MGRTRPGQGNEPGLELEDAVWKGMGAPSLPQVPWILPSAIGYDELSRLRAGCKFADDHLSAEAGVTVSRAGN